MAITGWASEMRWAASFRTSALRHPALSIVTRAIVSSPTRARRDALLVRSAAIPSIASSTAGPSMFHPLVIRRETADAHPDASLQEIPREPFRPSATHVVQLPEDIVFPRGSESFLDRPGPGGIHRHHHLDGGPRFPVRAIMAEEQGPRFEREEMPERLEIFLQIERRGGGDRHEDLVARKVQAGGVARVDASVPFIQDRELVGGMTGGVIEDQGMLSQVDPEGSGASSRTGRPRRRSGLDARSRRASTDSRDA